jgi:hypothetical protein
MSPRNIFVEKEGANEWVMLPAQAEGHQASRQRALEASLLLRATILSKSFRVENQQDLAIWRERRGRRPWTKKRNGFTA